MKFLIYAIILNPVFTIGQLKPVITQGQINYVKTVNMYAIISKNTHKDNEIYRNKAFEDYKIANPQFKKFSSTLVFKDSLSLYQPIDRLGKIDQFDRDPMVGQHNIIFKNSKALFFVSQKDVYGTIFLVKDSLKRIKWKITNEKREIAGYSCRRANGLTKDSVYVVAFYCEQIHASSGPESFFGLPGMILGVALPHENVTWFATEISEQAIGNKIIVPPAKGELISYHDLVYRLSKLLVKLGSLAGAALKDFIL